MIDQGFSDILTCYEIDWDLNQKIVFDKGLVLVALPSGFDGRIVSIQIDTKFEPSSPTYKIAY